MAGTLKQLSASDILNNYSDASSRLIKEASNLEASNLATRLVKVLRAGPRDLSEEQKSHLRRFVLDCPKDAAINFWYEWIGDGVASHLWWQAHDWWDESLEVKIRFLEYFARTETPAVASCLADLKERLALQGG